jgi:excisionase family DNA binding protein
METGTCQVMGVSVKQDETERELTALEAARQLDVDVNYLYCQLRQGRIAGRKVGDEWRIPKTAVQERQQRLSA